MNFERLGRNTKSNCSARKAAGGLAQAKPQIKFRSLAPVVRNEVLWTVVKGRTQGHSTFPHVFAAVRSHGGAHD